MTTKGQWDVDPETKQKLAQLSKKDGTGNDKCCDCGAPSPQWASPKFSTFICLTCAGIHRGLGVHVSFVRSVSMDAFKQYEMLRMQYGGNKLWQDFFNQNSTIPFNETTIKERYDSEVGEEWKERLTAKVENREFNKEEFQNRPKTSRTSTPEPSTLPINQKVQNEAYFARMGEVNSSKPDHLPPNQGGKYGGFGSTIQPSTHVDDEPKDPLTTITKGLGWFASTVGKQAKLVNDSYIQPTARNLASTDFASQAKIAALTAGQGLQSGAKGAADSFNKFIEGKDDKAHIEPEKKDFWDSFGTESKPNSIGTSTMKKNPGPKRNKEDGWGDDW